MLTFYQAILKLIGKSQRIKAMLISHIIYKLGDNISTDYIYPLRYTVDPSSPPPGQCAFGDNLPLNQLLVGKTPGKGIAIFAGRNFGCGVPMNYAIEALKAHLPELSIIAKSVPWLFYNTSKSSGYEIVICPTFEADVDDETEIQTLVVINKTKNKAYPRLYPGTLLMVFMLIVKFLYWLWCKITGKKK